MLYRGGGSEVGWVGLSGFSPILGKCRLPPPPPGGGCPLCWVGGWVGGLLILVDHRRCSWAEAVCRLCLGMKKPFFFQVDCSKAGDKSLHLKESNQGFLPVRTTLTTRPQSISDMQEIKDHVQTEG